MQRRILRKTVVSLFNPPSPKESDADRRSILNGCCKRSLRLQTPLVNFGNHRKPPRPPFFSTANRMPRPSIAAIVFLSMACVATTNPRHGWAGEVEAVDANSPALAAMRSPATLIVDGVAFADAVRQVAVADDANIWIDRGIDPTSPVMLGPLGPTRFQALQALARSRGAVVTLIDNFILVGRPVAVDRAAAAVAVAVAKHAESQPVPKIEWPEATTPREAMQIALGKAMATDLPHDLWPATSWSNTTPEIAAALVSAQFEAFPQNDSATSKNDWTRRYPSEFAKPIRRVVRELDPNATLRTSGRNLSVTTISEAHRLAMETVLTAKAELPKQSTSSFSLRATESAEAILRQLSAASNKQLVIDDRAAEVARVPITVEASAATVEALIDEVARQSGLTTLWTGDTVTISAP